MNQKRSNFYPNGEMIDFRLPQDFRQETLVDLRSLLREQNGRIRKNEKSIARIFGIGGTIMAGFSAMIGWLFNK